VVAVSLAEEPARPRWTLAGVELPATSGASDPKSIPALCQALMEKVAKIRRIP